MNKLRALGALTAGALLSAVPLAGTAEAAGPGPVRADIITESLPLGHFITAVAIQFSSKVDLEGASIDPAAFRVVGTRTSSVNGAVTSATRPVLRAYVNDEPALQAQGEKGKYLILELGSAGAAAGALQYSGGINNPYGLSYSVTQVADVLDGKGRVELESSETPVTTTSVLTPVVDEFAALSNTSSSGQVLNYRFYTPEAYDERPGRKALYPLVVTLHGAGERGPNNLTQITGNQLATAFAAPARQAKDPSFVLSPQVPSGLAWTTPSVQQALMETIDKVMAEYPVDPDRLYLTGLSLGGIGSFDILPKYPTKFAAAITVAATGNTAVAPSLVDLPIWATHSVDDPTVNYTTGSLALINAIGAAGARTTFAEWAGNLPVAQADALAQAQWDAAEANGSHTLLTAYSRGTTPQNAHWSWVPTYLNNTMLDWLYSHERTGGGSCTVSYRTSAWNGGFTGQAVVTNTSKKPVSGAELAFDLGSGVRVTKAWPGSFTQTAGNVTVSSAATIQPGKSATISFNATGTPGAAPAFALNGAVCS
ncbi:cellulose binding domain-containing protein [Motilibacter deserti]|uniref:Phospholipase n=1 Tax=Motilibacter deserti TaxID=2714956 RepID=A0ABX0GZW0_9ACTN|nr:cellulose binding domain-containing protein [Motilibacter deserti]NHC15110.1 phospholipase [Motilibacter deserti]